MKTQTKAKVITLKELARLRYPLPESWKRAAGMLKGRKGVDALKYQKEVRDEWEKRIKRQYALGGKP